MSKTKKTVTLTKLSVFDYLELEYSLYRQGAEGNRVRNIENVAWQNTPVFYQIELANDTVAVMCYDGMYRGVSKSPTLFRVVRESLQHHEKDEVQQATNVGTAQG